MAYNREVLKLKDFQGDPLEYEEFFRRILYNMNSTDIQHTEIVNDLLSLFNTNRSSTVIECAIKTLYAMCIKLSPSMIVPVIEIGSVLETYSLCINNYTEINQNEYTAWIELVRLITQSTIIHRECVFIMVCRISFIEEIRKMVKIYLNENISINSIKLSTVILKYKNILNENEIFLLLKKYITLLGNNDIFISKESSFFIKEYSNCNNIDIYSIIKENQLDIIDSLDNYIRDIFQHLPLLTKQCVISTLKTTNLIKIPLEIKNILKIKTKDNNISKKTVRYILLNEDTVENNHIININLSDDYYSKKDLSHLLTESKPHPSCIEY
ncbi:hypothetical protein NEPAR06_1855 [Nematocida parisii]|nr:hypothetical protein NEPAR07_2241 [Nematocida parisii]KAI5155469.1 hypothetical protein NEPAR06_1855 [Nematocida parisii]KAI5158156.1 hypothetical protein NEPAR05_1919 [Nematocida parisii]